MDIDKLKGELGGLKDNSDQDDKKRVIGDSLVATKAGIKISELRDLLPREAFNNLTRNLERSLRMTFKADLNHSIAAADAAVRESLRRMEFVLEDGLRPGKHTLVRDDVMDGLGILDLDIKDLDYEKLKTLAINAINRESQKEGEWLKGDRTEIIGLSMESLSALDAQDKSNKEAGTIEENSSDEKQMPMDEATKRREIERMLKETETAIPLEEFDKLFNRAQFERLKFNMKKMLSNTYRPKEGFPQEACDEIIAESMEKAKLVLQKGMETGKMGLRMDMFLRGNVLNFNPENIDYATLRDIALAQMEREAIEDDGYHRPGRKEMLLKSIETIKSFDERGSDEIKVEREDLVFKGELGMEDLKNAEKTIEETIKGIDPKSINENKREDEGER